MNATDKADETINKLVKKHGSLPNLEWLQAHGFEWLIQVIVPPRASHSPTGQRNPRKIYGPAKDVIKALVEKNDGLVPTATWLVNNGYAGLYHQILENPKLVAGYKRDMAIRGRRPS